MRDFRNFALLCLLVVVSTVESQKPPAQQPPAKPLNQRITVKSQVMGCTNKTKGDSKPPYHVVEKCHRKIRLTIDIVNSEKTPDVLEYIYVKEVVDNATGVKSRLLNGLVVQLRQNQIVLAYPFKYLSGINGKAHEAVVNYENKKDYKGCDNTSSVHPTCGLKHHNGKPVPYSEGFCCFCPEAPKGVKQARGGQDCSKAKADEPTQDLRKIKASAHCLRFNEVWFTVSALSDPKIMHELFLQVYNKRFMMNGSAVWVSLASEEFELNTNSPSQYDDNKTMVGELFIETPKGGTVLLSAKTNRLLIPQPLPGVEHEKLPEIIQNGAKDYLLISKTVIDSSGTKCDKAGASFEAFNTQKKACTQPKETCLKNQPLDFWKIDNDLRKQGKKGKYLLGNYGDPSKEPIVIDEETKEHYLSLDYYKQHRSVLTVEFNADKIVILSAGKFLQIQKVVTALNAKEVTLNVVVANKDLVAVKLSAKSAKCQFNVKDSKAESADLPPQTSTELVLKHQKSSLELSEEFTCEVQVSSKDYGMVSQREVKINPKDRCICNMYCECMCGDKEMTCEPLSSEDYHKAGFRGSVPLPTLKPHKPRWTVLKVLLVLVCIVLLAGFAKAVIGLRGNKKVGYFGLEPRIFGARQIDAYIDPELKGERVQYDDFGRPMDPRTRQPARVLSDMIIFALNVFFCCVYPGIKLMDGLQKRARDSKAPSAAPDSPTSGSGSDTGSGGSSGGKEPGTLEKLKQYMPWNLFKNRKGRKGGTDESSADEESSLGSGKGSSQRSSPGSSPTSSEERERQQQSQDKNKSSAGKTPSKRGSKSRPTRTPSALREQEEDDPDLISPELAKWIKGTNKVQAFLPP